IVEFTPPVIFDNGGPVELVGVNSSNNSLTVPMSAPVGTFNGTGIVKLEDCDELSIYFNLIINEFQCPGGGAPGDPCNDGDPCTINDVLLANCSCVGTFQDTDGDGVCGAEDLCPGRPEPGTPCNDNDPCTINDIIRADC